MAVEVGRRIRSQDLLLTGSRLMKRYGKPAFIRSDNGAEFTASAVMRWLRNQNVGPAFIAPGRPWQNGYVESFHGKLHDECLNRLPSSCAGSTGMAQGAAMSGRDSQPNWLQNRTVGQADFHGI
jgi:transposase InsO family protein